MGPKDTKRKKKTKTTKYAPYGNVNLTPYSFRRRFLASTYTWSTGTVNGFWNVMQMAFNQIPNSTDYSDLFSEYKIKRISVTFVPRYDGVDQTGAGTGAGLPMLHYKVETPTFLTPAGTYNQSTLNAYLDTNPKSVAFNKPVTVRFTPTLQTDINNAVVETSKPQWIRSTSPGNAAVHYGLSFFVMFNGFSSPTATFTTDVYYEFEFDMRNPA